MPLEQIVGPPLSVCRCYLDYFARVDNYKEKTFYEFPVRQSYNCGVSVSVHTNCDVMSLVHTDCDVRHLVNSN